MLRISSSSGCDTGDEWFPNRDEAAEGPTEETKGGQPTVLDFSSCLHSYSNALVEKQKKTTVFFFVWTYSFLDFSSFFERKTKEETKYARYARGPSHQVLFMLIESHVIHLSKKIELFLQKTRRWSRMRRRCTISCVDCHLNQIFSQIFKQIRQWFDLSTLFRHFL